MLLRFVANLFKTPSKCMLTTWILWLALYLLAPFHYTIKPNFFVIVFTIFCILSFCLGDIFTSFSIKQSKLVSKRPIISEEFQQKNDKLSDLINCSTKHSYRYKKIISLNRFVVFLALVGIFGAALFAVSKLFLSGLDYSEGISKARFQNQALSLSGNSSTPLIIYIAYTLFPFSIVAFIVSFLSNCLSKKTNFICKLSFVSPIVVNVMAGGRGSILHIFLMASSAIFIAKYSSGRQHLLSKQATYYKFPSSTHLFRISSIITSLVIIGAFIWYWFYIYADRRAVSNNTDISMYFAYLKAQYGIYPDEFLVNLVNNNLLDEELVVGLMQSFYYFTHGLLVFSKMVNSQVIVGPYCGQYQVPLVMTLLRKFFPHFSLSDQIFNELSAAGILGSFSSAWGMMFADFGWIGTLIEVFYLGCISRLVYFYAIARKRLGDQLLLTFIMASIYITPVLPPLGIGLNSFTLLSVIFVKKKLNALEQAIKL